MRRSFIIIFAGIALTSFCGAGTPVWGAAKQSEAVSALLKQLKDPSPMRRFEAIEGLGRLGTSEAIRALIRLTADDNDAWLAVRQLILLKDASVPELIRALDDSNVKVVKFAIHCLGELKAKEAVPRILDFRSHGEAEIRQSVVFALGYIRDPRAALHLVESLQDPDNVVREYAASALDYFGDQSAIPCLRDALKKEQGSIFNMAAALYHLGADDVIDILIEKLRDPRSQNKLYAVYALGKIRDPREVAPLIECLADQDVQWLAAKALVNLSDLAVPSLIKALDNKNREVRLYSIYSLGEIGDKSASRVLIEKLIDPDLVSRDYATEALVKLKDRDTIPRLLYLLEKGDCTIQTQVLRVLGALGDLSVTTQIYPLLVCDYAQVRMNAAFALGELKDDQAVDNLVAMLDDSNDNVRAMAQLALIKIGPAAVAQLRPLLTVKKGKAETGIIHVLGKLKAKSAVDDIIKKLASEDNLVRRAATVALTEIGASAAEEHLVMRLSDADPQVRLYATVGLMNFGGRLTVRLLLNALRYEETRWLAVQILDRVGARGVDELIAALRDERIMPYAADTLIKLDGLILPQLEEGLRSDEEIIRNNIAFVLGEVKDKRAVDALVEAMKNESRLVALAASSLVKIGDASAVEPLIICLDHDNEQVRLYAAYALGHLGDMRAVDPLLRALRDPENSIRGIAAYALGVLKAKRAVPNLVEMADEPDENVRLSVIYALGKIRDPQTLPVLRERRQADQSQRVRRAAEDMLEQMTFGSY